MKPITHTLEILAAIFAISQGYRKTKEDDGKTSKWELAMLAWNSRNEVRAALDGIEQVLPEIMDADEVETEELSRKVSEILSEWGVPHRIQDLHEEFMDDAINLAQSLSRILNRPPAALPA